LPLHKNEFIVVANSSPLHKKEFIVVANSLPPTIRMFYHRKAVRPASWQQDVVAEKPLPVR